MFKQIIRSGSFYPGSTGRKTAGKFKIDKIGCDGKTIVDTRFRKRTCMGAAIRVSFKMFPFQGIVSRPQNSIATLAIRIKINKYESYK